MVRVTILQQEERTPLASPQPLLKHGSMNIKKIPILQKARKSC